MMTEIACPTFAIYKFHDRQPTRLDRSILTHLAGHRGCNSTRDRIRIGMPRLANLLGMHHPANQCRSDRRREIGHGQIQTARS